MCVNKGMITYGLVQQRGPFSVPARSSYFKSNSTYISPGLNEQMSIGLPEKSDYARRVIDPSIMKAEIKQPQMRKKAQQQALTLKLLFANETLFNQFGAAPPPPPPPPVPPAPAPGTPDLISPTDSTGTDMSISPTTQNPVVNSTPATSQPPTNIWAAFEGKQPITMPGAFPSIPNQEETPFPNIDTSLTLAQSSNETNTVDAGVNTSPVIDPDSFTLPVDNQYTKQLTDQLLQKELDIANLQTELEDMSGRTMADDAEKQRLQGQIDTLEEEKSRLEEELKALNTSAVNTVQQLEEALVVTQQQLKAAQEALQQYDGIVKNKSQEQIQLESIVQNLNANIQQLLEDKQKLFERASGLMNENVQLNQHLGRQQSLLQQSLQWSGRNTVVPPPPRRERPRPIRTQTPRFAGTPYERRRGAGAVSPGETTPIASQGPSVVERPTPAVEIATPIVVQPTPQRRPPRRRPRPPPIQTANLPRFNSSRARDVRRPVADEDDLIPSRRSQRAARLDRIFEWVVAGNNPDYRSRSGPAM